MNTSKKIKVKFFTNISLELASILLEVNGKRILVDPGRNERNVGVNQILPFYELQNLDAIVITHYHGDHANLIDEILESGKFRGRVICHKATAEIIQTYYNVEESLAQIIKLDYRKSYDLLGNNMLTLYDAGHVLGSSVVYLKFKDKVIVITGDLGADFLPIVREPTTVFPRDVRIDLLIVDAKQAIRPRQVDSRITPLGDVIYRKLQDCFLFDDGNILIFAPMVQIPMMLYCLNYIFNNKEYIDIHKKVSKVYLDPQPKVLKLLDIFQSHKDLIDCRDKEYVNHNGRQFHFNKLDLSLPLKQNISRSIIITPNRNKFVRLFERYKESEKNDVLLLNQNIYSVLKGNTKLINEHCNIQIKRLPFLHFHPDLHELTKWCKKITDTVDVKQLIFYHYKNSKKAEAMEHKIKKDIDVDIELVHRLSDNSISI